MVAGLVTKYLYYEAIYIYYSMFTIPWPKTELDGGNKVLQNFSNFITTSVRTRGKVIGSVVVVIVFVVLVVIHTKILYLDI